MRPVASLFALAALVAALTFPAAAQTDILWRNFTDAAQAVETAPDGSVTVIGERIIRFSASGTLLWSVPRPGGDIPVDLALGASGEVYVLASVQNPAPARQDILIYRINSDGALAWSQSFDGPTSGNTTLSETDLPFAIVATSTGTIVTVAQSAFDSEPNTVLWTQGYSPGGTLLWSRTVARSTGELQALRARQVAADCAGNVFIVGSFNLLNNPTDPSYLLSYANDGTERFMVRLFGRRAAGSGEESTVYLNEVAADCTTGAVYVAGQDSYNVANSSGGRDIDRDAFVARYDGATQAWQAFPFTGVTSGRGLSSTEGVQNLAVGPSGEVYASTETGNAQGTTDRVETVRLASNGTTAWVRPITGTNARVGQPIAAGPDGITVVTTVTNPSTTLYSHYAPDGVLQWDIARLNSEAGGAINRLEGMAAHPDGGVVWLEGSSTFPVHAVRVGPPPDVAIVQVVHASGAIAPLGPIEIYINQPGTSTTPDATVSFRGGSRFLTVPAAETINVRARLQNPPPIPGLPREYTFTVPPTAPGSYAVSIAGIPEQLVPFFAANPRAVSILMRLVAARLAFDILTPLQSAGEPGRHGGGVPVTVTHAVTDAPDLDVVLVPSGQVLADDLEFGEAVSDLSLAPGTYRVQVRRASDQAQLAVVEFAIDGTEGAFPLTISGFVDPSANQNGAPLALTATDTTGTTDTGVIFTDMPAGPTAGLALAVANPARGGAAVRFSTPAPGAVRVVLFDALGRAVAVLADGERAAGTHTAVLPDRLAPGTYVVRLEAGTTSVSRSLSVVR